jgi:hypothetical protein
MKDEALKMAMDDLIAEYHMEASSFAKRVDEIFKQALAADVREPVATLFGSLPVYDTPPAAQRPWVGLTDEERDDLLDNYITAEGRARAIEAKLKEKNNG